MNQQILSQDEVDALLQGITSDEEAGAPQDTDAAGVRGVDLAGAERIVRGRMPALEVVNERFARNMRAGLLEIMRRLRLAPEARVTRSSCQIGDVVS